jgi:hypothetical protein
MSREIFHDTGRQKGNVEVKKDKAAFIKSATKEFVAQCHLSQLLFII